MKVHRPARISLPIITALIAAFLPSASAQLVIGQYEPEAPLRTWNIFGFERASALGRGGASFALAEDCSTALTNPALLTDLPGITLTLNGAANHASLFKYALVNTGVLSTQDNLSLNSLALDFGGVSIQAGNWSFGLSAAVSEIYDRPGVKYEYSSQGRLAYTLDFAQGGFLRNINFSIARRFGGRLRAGLGVNYAAGGLDRETVEEYPQTGITISDRKEHDLSGIYFNCGAAIALSARVDLALIFRTPYVRKSDSRSEIRYAAPAGGTDIRIDAESSDRYRQPLVVGLGARYRASTRFQLLADLAYFNWSKYRVDYFDETLERDFKNIFKACLGAEYALLADLFGAAASLRDPGSAYTYYTVGAGLLWRMIALDIGASFGQENGSGRSLSARRLAISFSLRL
jgi:hypothetical protein